MIEELLSFLGEDYREVSGGGSGRNSSIHVLQSADDYRIAHIVTDVALTQALAYGAFTKAIGERFPKGVVAVEKIGRLSGGTYWISTVIPGHPQSLQARLETKGLLTASEIADVGSRVCDILHELHSHDQLHGGLTPGNIFAVSEERVLITESGVSQALEVLGVNSRSFPRQSSYLSPEELSGKTPSAQSEIFSLGIIFYELLTGKRPFGGRTTTMVMATVLTDDITSSTESADDDADRIVAAILRALEKDPADRWNSAAQFAAALRGEAATKQPTKFSSPERGCLPTIVLLSGSAAAVHYLLI